MSSRSRSKPLAIATVVGTLATLGYMYVAGVQTKNNEGKDSIYHDAKNAKDLKPGDSDSKMGSSGVRSAMHGDKK